MSDNRGFQRIEVSEIQDSIDRLDYMMEGGCTITPEGAELRMSPEAFQRLCRMETRKQLIRRFQAADNRATKSRERG